MITLATLSTATEQQVFDQVYAHLLKQKKPAMAVINTLKRCAYRGTGGTSCAIGCLIADNEYKASFEANAWSRLVGEKKVPGAHLQLLLTLQGIHDEIEPEKWPQALAETARLFKLKVPVQKRKVV